MPTGFLSITLHAHLPYVRHPEREQALEERWLFEAITECYIPLIRVMEKWTEDGVDWRLTLSVSPPLCAMLRDSLLGRRYEQHIASLIDLAHHEVARLQGNPDYEPLAIHYLWELQETLRAWHRYRGDITNAWRVFLELGYLELITTSATHVFLPAVLTEEAVNAQVETAVHEHKSVFGIAPKGFWLPECAYRPGIDEVLSNCGVRYTYLDAPGVLNARPAPVFGSYQPVVTSRGLAVFARDAESAKQVWSASDGYPGDYDYREFYRDIGYELPEEYISPYLTDGIRTDTGLKYWRITGDGAEKGPYSPAAAREKATEHAGHFLWCRQRQLESLRADMGKPAIVTAMYDAELFGHWWYEGPMFLDFLVRKIHFDQDEVKLATPSQYLDDTSELQVVELQMNSWGRHGYAEVWVNESNDWIYKALHNAEREMTAIANAFRRPSALEQRALAQAARELLLAQSSDFAFIMDNKTSVEYALRRTKGHINTFFRLRDMLAARTIDEDWLLQVEFRDAVFADIDYTLFQSRQRGVPLSGSDKERASIRVLMLSWEFPPEQVGGLSPHVYHLSRGLVACGVEVHVLTKAGGNTAAEETVDGIHVHRVHVRTPHGATFLDWVLQLNLAMMELVQQWGRLGLTFDVIHAHDWLVHTVAKFIKDSTAKPLVCTIHATEHGRNQGIHTELQNRIHRKERSLTDQADKVIVCSQAMADEVKHLFQLPSSKVHVIPNGVDVPVGGHGEPRGGQERWLEWVGDRPVVCFVGRMVPEKGVDVLLEAVPEILHHVPETVFLLAGKGPMLNEWQVRARDISHQIHFLGYITDVQRNVLLARATVCVFPSKYEPFGIVALEAMAQAKPVVVSDAGGLKEVVTHGVTGLTCYAGHVASLSHQVVRLLRDETLAKRLSQAAQQTVRSDFSWHGISSATRIVYEQVSNETVECEGEEVG